MKILKERTEIPVTGIWQVLLELGIDPVTEETVAIQDACGARGDHETQDQIRAFAAALGCQTEEIPFFGGSFSLLRIRRDGPVRKSGNV